MKKTIKTLIIIMLIAAPAILFAQPHPNNGGGPPGGGNTPVGGGAPLGSGFVILLSLGAAYGMAKAYRFWKNE